MAVSHRSFIAIEQSLADRLYRAFKRYVAPVLLKAGIAWDQEDETALAAALAGIDFTPVYDANKKYLKYAGQMSLMFGATRVTRRPNTNRFKQADVQSGLANALEQVGTAMTKNFTETLQKDFQKLFLSLDRDWYKGKDQAYSTSGIIEGPKKPQLPLFQSKDFKQDYQTFVDNKGRALSDLAANLHTSRLSSWGFTLQAPLNDVTRYEISEVLDDRTCPICAEMHGRSFEVETARAFLENVLATDDPNEIKNLHPWPKQDDVSVAALKEMAEEEIIARGWQIPPYHPGCRGILVREGETSIE